MTDPTDTLQELAELDHELTRAEVDGDIAALDALATDDFMLVGPLGFVLDKQQWLDRYRGGGLNTKTLAFEDPVTRVYGDAALRIGRHVQEAEFQGRPVDGEFRATHIAVRQGARWRLAGVQLSPIGGPPPFARPADPTEPPR
jgi:ketosteroid isomerase-like protein